MDRPGNRCSLAGEPSPVNRTRGQVDPVRIRRALPGPIVHSVVMGNITAPDGDDELLSLRVFEEWRSR